MTTESTQPQTELGPVPANGQGQSQGHRRRRRRRKNKSSQAGALQTQQAQSQTQRPAPPAQPKAAHTHQTQQSQGHSRKKKKFFQKGSATAAQPGNSISGPSQGKRKGKQKGPREFVGPMDHSYRAVNGNISDGPPSTIQITSNGHNSHYQESYVPEPALPVREDAPTRIFCFIEDLFFQAKIQETARKLGVKVEFVKGADKEAVARLADMPDAERPTLLVFDLNNLNAKPMTLIPKFKAKLKKATSIIGFLNHLQSDLKLKAIEAGCDTVMPRSAFSQSLPNLLRRYGIEEEEEYAQQPV
ncbi:MAG: response regulator [Terracidiphilus sp.]|jgi:CheY-like chemotaxis protein